MIRVVLDTNVVVSALLQPLGPSAHALLLAVNGAVQLCLSAEIYCEYEDVLRRPRLRIPNSAIDGAVRAIRRKSLWVRPVVTITACSDPDDNCFLECAATAEADYLVTGNTRHFPAQWNETRIVTPRIFLERLTSARIAPPKP